MKTIVYNIYISVFFTRDKDKVRSDNIILSEIQQEIPLGIELVPMIKK